MRDSEGTGKETSPDGPPDDMPTWEKVEIIPLRERKPVQVMPEAAANWSEKTGLSWDFWRSLGTEVAEVTVGSRKHKAVAFVFSEPELEGFAMIRDLEAEKKHAYRTVNEPPFTCLWPSPDMSIPHPEILICEGQKDVAWARYLGFDAYTMGSCKRTPSPVTIRKIREMQTTSISILLDSDKGGIEGSKANNKVFLTEDFDSRVLNLLAYGKGYEKDFADVVKFRGEKAAADLIHQMMADTTVADNISYQAVLSDIDETDWLWEGRIARGKLTLFYGDPKLAKSWHVAFLARRSKTGGEYLGAEVVPFRMLNYSEMGKPVDARRKVRGFDEGGFDTSNLFIRNRFDLIFDGKDWEEMVDVLKQDCKREGIDLLVVDTLGTWFQFEGTEAWVDAIIRAKMAPLVRLGQKLNIGVLLLAHTNNQGKVSGARSALEGVPDIIIEISGKPEEDEEKVISTRGRFAANESFRTIWRKGTDEPEFLGEKLREQDKAPKVKKASEAQAEAEAQGRVPDIEQEQIILQCLTATPQSYATIKEKVKAAGGVTSRERLREFLDKMPGVIVEKLGNGFTYRRLES